MVGNWNCSGSGILGWEISEICDGYEYYGGKIIGFCDRCDILIVGK